VALVSRAKREVLLRVHRHRLRREDLEDCYSQATLELVAHARGGGRFAGPKHVANALEQRFLSRVHDRRRALSGRSPMHAALETSLPLHCSETERLDVIDLRAELEALVMLRQELRRVQALAMQLAPDQRLVLAAQIGGVDRGEFRRRYGWSAEKYRKVAQRARARLKALMATEGVDVPLAAQSSEGVAGRPMTISPPTHSGARRGAGGRLNGRSRGASDPRASGRDPESSPLRLPAARGRDGQAER
jgi:DNA-directed RNA polymerase specialized sigma24 family protein